VAVFVSLTLLNALGALALAKRLRAAEGRAELVVATSILGYALILAPIFALGFLRRLTALNLGVASASLGTVVLAASIARRDWRAFLGELARDAAGVLRTPADALAIAWRARSPAVVAVPAAVALVVWSAASAYYAPSAGWDAIWYHEPIVGFTIQNHGFHFVALPDSLQRVNSYPRVVEMIELWCVIFFDRRLIDLANVLATPMLAAATYLVCRRASGDRPAALAWASAMLFVPACLVQLHSAYVDVTFSALLLASACFVARPELRLSDAWLAQLGLTLAVGCKYQALVPVGVLLVVLWSRVLARHGRARSGATALTLTTSGALVLAMMASIYLRNYHAFHNPFWPHLVTDRFDWPGWPEPGQSPGGGVDLNLPFTELVGELYADPLTPTHEGNPASNYGLVVPWLVVPLGVCALLRLLFVWAGATRRGHGEESARPLLFLFLPALAMMVTSPAIHTARYHLFVVAVVMAMSAWFIRAVVDSSRAAWAVAAGVTLLGLMTAWVSGGLVSLTLMRKLASTPFPERELRPDLGAPVTLEGGTARERELGAGDVVVFDDNYVFPALYWNNRYSNVVVYVPSSFEVPADAAALGAKWLYCGWPDECYFALRLDDDAQWEPVARLSEDHVGRAYRRRADPAAQLW
jgi:hypothetical protein